MIHTTRPSKASIYFQCILWGFAMIAFGLVGATAFEGSGGSLVLAIVGNVIVNFLLANTHIYVVFPHFFLRKKYLQYILTVLILLFSSIVFKVLFIFLFNSEINTLGHDPNETAPIIATITSVFAFIFSFLFRMIDNLIDKQRQEAQLKEAQLMSELGFLRSQINPHALFNVLNTIYSMIYTGSKEAGETVLKLSELMRYMLYETTDKFIPISKEVNYINTYIELYTIKQKGNCSVNFSAENIPDHSYIPPLLLIPFIENAFKHGNWDSLDPKGWIEGNVFIVDDKLHFELSNSVGRVSVTESTVGGIGIENVQKRLEILYPNRFELSTKSTENSYNVILTLDLNQ